MRISGLTRRAAAMTVCLLTAGGVTGLSATSTSAASGEGGTGPGAVGATTTIVRPGSLPRGEDPQVPYIFRGTLVHGEVRVDLPRGSHLLGASGGAYLVAVHREAAEEFDVLRVHRDGSRRTILTTTDRASLVASSDGASLFRHRTLGHYPDFRTVINVHDGTTGERTGRRVFRGHAGILDAVDNRVVLSKSGPTPRTLWWNHATNATRTIVGQVGYTADIRANRLATLTGDPYEGGCSVLRRLTAPAEKLLRSCKERIEAIAPDGRRVATVHILSDGLGPREVTVRGSSGRRQARYQVAGWFGSTVFETNRALLLEANGRHKSAAVRCENGSCERASTLVPVPKH